MEPILTTRIVIDGIEAHGTVAELRGGYPTVLDNVAITWGRGTTVDQPGAGSCSFTLRQQLGGQPAVGTLFSHVHVGSTVEVWVTGTINPPAPPGNETMDRTDFGDDPTGALDPARWGTSSSTTTEPITATVFNRFGRRAEWIDSPTSMLWSAYVLFPPKPFAASGVTDAWDAVPRLLLGASWPITVTVRVPAGTGPSRLAAAATTTPQRGGYTWCRVTDLNGRNLTIPADGAWHTITGIVQLPTTWTDAAGAWIVPALYLANMPDQTTWSDSDGVWTDHPEAWRDRRLAGLAFISLTQTAPTARDVLVWGGNVTAAHVKPAGDHAVTLEASASDPSARLSNNTIGDTPWPQNQTVYTRARRIQTLAHDDMDLIVDPGLRGYRLAYRDVDAQPVLGLLQDLATSAGGVLWVASHARAGTYLWMEDPNGRLSAFIFVIDPATGLVIIGGNERNAALLSASDILLDPLDAGQDSTNVITSVDVTWQLMTGTDPDTSQPILEEHTVTETEPTSSERFQRFGLVTQSVPTELTTEIDAVNRATRSLEQARANDWQLDGLTVDTRVLTRPIPEISDTVRRNVILDLLDGLRRIGLALTILDMPTWLPEDVSGLLYVEGGNYTLADGKWELALTVAPAGSLGHSAQWNEMPVEVSWSDMSRSIRWVDAYGVAAPNPTRAEEVA